MAYRAWNDVVRRLSRRADEVLRSNVMHAHKMIALGAAFALGFAPVSGAFAQGGDANVLDRERVAVDAQGNAKAVRDLQVAAGAKGTAVTLVLDGGLRAYERIELDNPPRLALDPSGVGKAPASKQLGDGVLSGVRFGVHPDRVRVVCDVRGDVLPKYRLDVSGDRVSIFFEGGQIAAPAVAASAPAAPAAPAKARARVLDVAFQGEGPSQQVEVKLTGKARYEVERPDARTRVLTLRDAELPRKLVRSLDTTAFAGPVRTVASFQDGADGVVRVVVTLAEQAKDEVRLEGSTLAWRFTGKADATIVDEAGRVTRAAAETGP